MNYFDLDKLPRNVEVVLTPLLDELIELYGEEIVSVFVYGSVTGSEYNAKASDINVAVVLKEVSLEKLKPVLKPVKKGMKNKINAPLFLTPSYIKMSLDTFPMEFMSMKDSRLVVAGEDILADINVRKEDLRRECEYQLKGKLLTIRQAYLEQALNRKGLGKLVKTSLRALMPVFQNLLRIKGQEVPPRAKEEILSRISAEFDVDVAAFLDVLRDNKDDGCIAGRAAESFLGDFLKQLEILVETVDKM
ncbi:MAG: hypothetical protein ABH844_05210 [Candidatus Omnitrophota bacterium]